MRTALRSRRFAARIIRRFERRVSAPRPLALALVRIRPAPRVHVLPARRESFSTLVRIEPRIVLTLIRPTEVRAVAAEKTPGTSSLAQAPLFLTTVVHGRVRQLVERIAARGARVERLLAVDSHAHPTAPGAPSAGSIAPIPLALTVRRPSPAPVPTVATPREHPAATFASAPDGLRPVGAAGLHTPELAATLDIQAVTDSVIAAIDRRVVAEAERTGSL